MKERLTGLIQTAIDAGQFPQGTSPHAVFRILSAAIHGAAVMRLCERLAPGEDADALARDTLEAALTGLRTGFDFSSARLMRGTVQPSHRATLTPTRGLRMSKPIVRERY